MKKTKTIYLDNEKQFRFDLVLDKTIKTKIKNNVLYELNKNPFVYLNNCYDSYSYNKASAYDKELRKAIKLNADKWGIISYNSMMFTFGYTFKYNDKNYVALITKDYDYLVELENE